MHGHVCIIGVGLMVCLVIVNITILTYSFSEYRYMKLIFFFIEPKNDIKITYYSHITCNILKQSYYKLVAKLVMGRVCIGQAGYGPSLSWAKFGMGRDVQLP